MNCIKITRYVVHAPAIYKKFVVKLVHSKLEFCRKFTANIVLYFNANTLAELISTSQWSSCSEKTRIFEKKRYMFLFGLLGLFTHYTCRAEASSLTAASSFSNVSFALFPLKNKE